jgi:hypothetical protein
VGDSKRSKRRDFSIHVASLGSVISRVLGGHDRAGPGGFRLFGFCRRPLTCVDAPSYLVICEYFGSPHLKRTSLVKKVTLGPKPLRVNGGLPALALLAFAVGGIASLVGALFRLLLEWSDRFRDAFINWAYGKGFDGFALPRSAKPLVVFMSLLNISASFSAWCQYSILRRTASKSSATDLLPLPASSISMAAGVIV